MLRKMSVAGDRSPSLKKKQENSTGLLCQSYGISRQQIPFKLFQAVRKVATGVLVLCCCGGAQCICDLGSLTDRDGEGHLLELHRLTPHSNRILLNTCPVGP
jgi:hypothetical protein